VLSRVLWRKKRLRGSRAQKRLGGVRSSQSAWYEGSGVIRLVHYTTQEYFERTKQQWFPDAEAKIARACIAYLALKDTSSLPYDLYKYAAQNWGDHARQASDTQGQVLDFLQLPRHVKRITLFLDINDRFDPVLHGRGWIDMTTGLHLAAYFGLEAAAIALLQQGFDPAARTILDETPLMAAAGKGHDAIVKILIENHATTTAVDLIGYTAVHHAVKGGNDSTVRLLLSDDAIMASSDELLTDDVDLVNSRHQTPLHIAAERGHIAVVKLLLEAKAMVDPLDYNNCQPLWFAAWKGHEVIVEILLAYGAPVNDPVLVTPPLGAAAYNGNAAIVKLLLDPGADINAFDVGSQRTALYHAANYPRYAIIELLLEAGAKVDIPDIDGKTAIMCITSNGDSGIPIVQHLLHHGADINVLNSHRQSTLWYVAQKGQPLTLQLLLEAGANPNFEESPLAAARKSLSDYEKRHEDSEHDPRDPYREEYRQQYRDCIKILLEAGAR
jgi:ankyrin repeat protein